jgi:L-aspartate oxidase
MGGVAADPDGRTSLEGLYAVGECAATGVHGANRLASNSLLEAAAFGRRTGREAARAVMPTGPITAGAVVDDLPTDAHAELRAAMSAEAGVIRDAAGLSRLVALIDRLEATYGAPPALAAARLIAEAALARHESRGGHYRSDYPETAAQPEHTHVRHGAVISEAA